MRCSTFLLFRISFLLLTVLFGRWATGNFCSLAVAEGTDFEQSLTALEGEGEPASSSIKELFEQLSHLEGGKLSFYEGRLFALRYLHTGVREDGRNALRALQSAESDQTLTSFEKGLLFMKKGEVLLRLGQKELGERNLQRAREFLPKENSASDIKNTQQNSGSSLKKKLKPLVVLDPGHGGSDRGAIGDDGIIEKELVLEVSLLLKQLLELSGKVDVAMTRSDDTFVPLSERTKFANNLGATVFVSLHANATTGNNASGFAAFYLDNTGDFAARKLAERENAAISPQEGSTGEIQFILSDLMQNGKVDGSITLAHKITKNVSDKLTGNYQNVRIIGTKKAPFYVLVGAHMPCVLLELFFIDNPKDTQNLKDPKFIKEMTVGLADGILSFVQDELTTVHER